MSHSTQDPRYKNYLLTVLLIVLAFNFVYRLPLGIVLQDIKIDLGLRGTQLGLLTGIAFAAFCVVMGSPLVRWTLVALGPDYIWSAWNIWRASRAAMNDAAAAQREGEAFPAETVLPARPVQSC